LRIQEFNHSLLLLNEITWSSHPMGQAQAEAISNVNRWLRSVKRFRFYQHKDKQQQVSTTSRLLECHDTILQMWAKAGSFWVNEN
jgi:hypothetical protein